MKKENRIVTAAVVVLGIVMSFVWMSLRYPVVVPKRSKTSLDTVKTKSVCVSGKRVLFIGDSHTANPKGWQDRLCKKTGMTYKNVSVGGKSTPWMVQQAVTHVRPTYNFCFIYLFSLLYILCRSCKYLFYCIKIIFYCSIYSRFT